MRHLLLALALALAACDSNSPETGTVLWRAPATAEALAPTQPLASGDTLFVAFGEQFSALEARTGAEIWRAPVRLSGGSAAGAVIDGGDAVVLNYLTWVKAFRKTDGRLLWTAPLDETRSVDRVRLARSATHLFLPRSGEVVRIRLASGEIDARLDVSDFAPEGVPALGYDAVLAPEADVLVVALGFFDPVAAETEGAVVAFDAASGARRWVYRPPPQALPEGGSPVGTAVFGVEVGAGLVFAPVGQEVVALDARTGTVQWTQPFAADAFDAGATYDAASGAVYVGSLRGRVYALDAQTGARQWTTELSGSLSTVITVRDGRLYLTSPFEGSAWVLDARGGALLARTRPEGDRLLAPIAVDGRAMYSASSTAAYALAR